MTFDEKVALYNEMTDKDRAHDFLKFTVKNKTRAPLLEQTSGRAQSTGQRYTTVVGGKHTLRGDFVDYLDGKAPTAQKAEELREARFHQQKSRRRFLAARYGIRNSGNGAGSETDMSTRLRRRLAAANGKWSQAVEMVCYQGMSQRAAAREIGVDHKTVSYRLHQGLDLLLEWAALELGEG